MKAICHDLEKASEPGLLKVLKDFLTTINLHVKQKGKRYEAYKKLFFEAVLVRGGPRLVTFVASNLFGPETLIEGEINYADMSKIAVIYSESIA